MLTLVCADAQAEKKPKRLAATSVFFMCCPESLTGVSQSIRDRAAPLFNGIKQGRVFGKRACPAGKANLPRFPEPCFSRLPHRPDAKTRVYTANRYRCEALRGGGKGRIRPACVALLPRMDRQWRRRPAFRAVGNAPPCPVRQPAGHAANRAQEETGTLSPQESGYCKRGPLSRWIAGCPLLWPFSWEYRRFYGGVPGRL